MATWSTSPGHGDASFFSKLTARAEKIDSLLCVGLDPHQSELGDDCSANGARAFCSRLIEATSSVALAYKPNSAFFEAFGAEGLKALKDVISSVPDDIPVVLDVKRGDIKSTATAYASAAFKELGAQCVTLNAYMGADAVKPFLEDPTRGAFVLCKTSNESSNELQTLPVGCSGKSLYEEVASLCQSWNTLNNVGLVVGATDTDALARVRAAAPGLWILAPGVGPQGADLEASCEAALDARGLGLILPISRGISRAPDPGLAAMEFKYRINAARKNCKRQSAAGTKGDAHPLLPYQREFIDFALNQKVLKFGEYELKSGRISPYFFNAGLFCTGWALSRLAKFYAEVIVRAQPPLEFDVIFGPAYKGIPLGASVALMLADLHGLDVGFAYNRKEPKDHGDGGKLVGAPLEGKRILILDDVITAGTAIRESMDILMEVEAKPVGVVVALDRQEVTGAEPQLGEGDSTGTVGGNSGGGMSAVQQIEEAFGIPVVSVVGLDDLTSFMVARGEGEGGADAEALESLRAYRATYGVR